MDDRELHELLQQWKAPAAPPNLEKRVFTPVPDRWWRWLLRGSIRVPVPLGAVLLAILVVSLYAALTAAGRQIAPPVRHVSLADFQPVPQLEVRIVRSPK
jgi:hypothetical protein